LISLLDVNMLVALFDAAHVHHQAAQAWMTKNRALGWATCPITQNGCVRVMSQPQYPGALPVAEMVHRLAGAIAAEDHTFWPDTVSLCDRNRFELGPAVMPRALTDIYLLALSRENGGRLVTFDRAISLANVRASRAANLLVL